MSKEEKKNMKGRQFINDIIRRQGDENYSARKNMGKGTSLDNKGQYCKVYLQMNLKPKGQFKLIDGSIYFSQFKQMDKHYEMKVIFQIRSAYNWKLCQNHILTKNIIINIQQEKIKKNENLKWTRFGFGIKKKSYKGQFINEIKSFQLIDLDLQGQYRWEMYINEMTLMMIRQRHMQYTMITSQWIVVGCHTSWFWRDRKIQSWFSKSRISQKITIIARTIYIRASSNFIYQYQMDQIFLSIIVNIVLILQSKFEYARYVLLFYLLFDLL